jgi:hypothetical protein
VIEDNVCIVFEPHFRALGYSLSFEGGEARLTKVDGGGVKVHSSFQGEVYVSEHDDLGAMLDVAEKLLDRVYGKPKQSTELTGADNGPIKVEGVDVSKLTDDELVQLRELLSRAGPVA